MILLRDCVAAGDVRRLLLPRSPAATAPGIGSVVIAACEDVMVGEVLALGFAQARVALLPVGYPV